MKNNASGTKRTFLRPTKGAFKIFSKSWFMFLVLVVVAAGCKKVIEEPGIIGVCPKVISTSPADAAIDINLTTSVDATFNEAMNASTINATTFTVAQGLKAIPGAVSYSGTTATFIPSNALSPNTTYTGTITTGVKDPANNAMVSNYVWNFTTGAGPDVTAPTVTVTDPANAAIGVAFDKMITATFSEAMDSLAATTSFALTNTTLGGTAVAGSVSYSNKIAVFAPSANLSPNTTYTGMITTSAKDLAG
ncbi:MAG TPA: Ig-like domain-containing protein, partial [Niastella sp.]|nr:Ig-like domain-containing protein [Niastella sp.]